MRISTLVSAAAALLATAVFAPSASATTSTLYINGRQSGTPAGWSYWYDGSAYMQSGVNPIAVNVDGGAHISVSNPTVVAALNANCTGGNSCNVVCHSAGCAQIGYAEALYPGAWNITQVVTAASAEGGSELAGNVAYFFTGLAIDQDLADGTMRGLYNHDIVGDDIAGYVYNFLGGDYASLTTCLFPGGCLFGSGANDSAVAMGSSGRNRSSGSTEKGSSSGVEGGNYWDYSIAAWTDSSDGVAGHCIDGSYPCEEGTAGGVVGKATAWVTKNNL